jgi:hypothetical protein
LLRRKFTDFHKAALHTILTKRPVFCLDFVLLVLVI